MFFEKYDDIRFLIDDYPDPADFSNFNIENVSNIYGLDFIEFETAYLKDEAAWVVNLIEPDNDNEGKNINGRTFTTELFVYKLKASVALGIKVSCREPEDNTDDADVYRLGFVRELHNDEDILISEFGIDPVYSFPKNPFIINGKIRNRMRSIL